MARRLLTLCSALSLLLLLLLCAAAVLSFVVRSAVDVRSYRVVLDDG